jgi:hypothetical protein
MPSGNSMDCGDVVKGERLEVFFFAVCLVALIITHSLVKG